MFQEFRAGRQRSTATDNGPVYGTAVADPHAAATATLLRAAGATQWPLAEVDQKRMVRRARAKMHPDINGNDQSGWDEVQAAARVLKLA